MKTTIILLLISLSSYSQCTKLVNGIAVPCTQEEIAQRVIDSTNSEIERLADSITHAKKLTTYNNLKAKVKLFQNSTLITSLTSAQTRDFLSLVLWVGIDVDAALNENGTIRPVDDWAQ